MFLKYRSIIIDKTSLALETCLVRESGPIPILILWFETEAYRKLVIVIFIGW